MKRNMELTWLIVIVLLSLAFSFAMAVALIWVMRVFGAQIDYSWQYILAVWVTMVAIKGLMSAVKE